MDTRARHLILDIWLEQTLSEEVLELLRRIIRSSTTVLDEYEYRYPIEGATLLFILSESHCLVHTYPEQRYLLVDLYVCDPSVDLEGVAESILEPLQVKESIREIRWRGIRAGSRAPE